MNQSAVTTHALLEPPKLPTTPPDDRRSWERLLRTLGFAEVRHATHGTMWGRETGERFLLPRLSGHAKRLDPCARRNMLAQLRRLVEPES